VHNVLNRRRFIACAGGAIGALALPARGDVPVLRVGLQDGGTAQWEVAAMKALGLPARLGFAVDIRVVADSAAGQVAFKASAVDIILSDFVWVSVERSLGSDATLVPFSLAVGGLFAGPSGPKALQDLRGTTIGVGGGPLDKSWLFLQAAYHHATGRDLKADTSPKFGAPPLINALLLRGDISAALNFWQWNARALLAGAQSVLTVAQMLSLLGVDRPPPLLGWTFSQRRAEARPQLFRAFFAASAEAKQHLLTDDDLWSSAIRPLMDASDDHLFEALRDGYRQGVPSVQESDRDIAAAAYGLLAQYGGSDLVQGATTLSPGTFWEG
jgi:NitT/TauT family transport system substrate-binding protein